MKTGWPPGLLQDDDKKLSQWFASRIDARWQVRRVCEEIERERVMKDTLPPMMTDADITSVFEAMESARDKPWFIRYGRAIEYHVRQQYADAVAVEREACAKLCEEIVTYPAGHRGQWEGYGPVRGTRSGEECAEAIRSRG